MHQLDVCIAAVLQPSFSYFFFIEIRHDLKVFHLRLLRNVVWVLIVFVLYVHAIRGNIITVLVNIVFPS